MHFALFRGPRCGRHGTAGPPVCAVVALAVIVVPAAVPPAVAVTLAVPP